MSKQYFGFIFVFCIVMEYRCGLCNHRLNDFKWKGKKNDVILNFDIVLANFDIWSMHSVEHRINSFGIANLLHKDLTLKEFDNPHEQKCIPIQKERKCKPFGHSYK